jgi:hypothetical protein
MEILDYHSEVRLQPRLQSDLPQEATMTENDRISALENQFAQMSQQIGNLQHAIGMLEDTHAVRCLQHKYGYYIDKCLYDEAVALFAEDCEVHFLGGIFRGKASAHRLYCEHFRNHFVGGKNGPVYGSLLDHPMMQDIVDVAPDRKTAKARLRCNMMAGRHESAGPTSQWWEGALYENQYVKVDGIWRIQVLNYHPIWHADFESGWAHTPPQYVSFYKDTYPGNPLGPDELEESSLWPHTDVFPFHYPHPVTGEVLAGDMLRCRTLSQEQKA